MINIYIYLFNFGSLYFYISNTRPLKEGKLREMHKQVKSMCSCGKSPHKVYISD